MKGMRKQLGMLAAFAMLAMDNPKVYSEPDLKRKKLKSGKYPVTYKELKEFRYEQGVITALNQKNADKKARRLKWII